MDPLGLASNSTLTSLASRHPLPSPLATEILAHSTTQFVNHLGATSLPRLDSVSTTTIFAIIYVPLPSNAPSPSPLLAPSSSLSSSKNATLESYASGNEYSGYSFVGLATIAFSTILTLLVLVTAFACILVQSQRMKKVMRDLEDGGTSEAEIEMLFNGIEDSGRKMSGKAGGRSERDGLLDVDESSTSDSDTSLDRPVDVPSTRGRKRRL